MLIKFNQVHLLIRIIWNQQMKAIIHLKKNNNRIIALINKWHQNKNHFLKICGKQKQKKDQAFCLDSK